MKYIEEIYKKRRIDTRWEKAWIASFFGALACITIYLVMSPKIDPSYDFFLILGVLLMIFAGLMFFFSIEVLEKKYKVLEIEEKDSNGSE